MGTQRFERLLEGDPPLLRRVETLVVDAHRRHHEAAGAGGWSEPLAYRWLRYEDPDPVARLADGVEDLRRGVAFDAAGVEMAINFARSLGYR